MYFRIFFINKQFKCKKKKKKHPMIHTYPLTPALTFFPEREIPWSNPIVSAAFLMCFSNTRRSSSCFVCFCNVSSYILLPLAFKDAIDRLSMTFLKSFAAILSLSSCFLLKIYSSTLLSNS